MGQDEPAQRSGEPAAGVKELTPGLATLLHGPETAEAQASARAADAPPSAFVPRRGLQFTLVLTDVLLLALAVELVSQAQGPLGWLEVVLCVLALAIGALLSCWAFWLEV